ncbi:hypothetical protein D3C80_1550150 [compost metagenome]
MENEPVSGEATAISASMRMTSTTSPPARIYARMVAGPASAMARPEPTNRPAPITPAMDNMVTCRDFNP